MQVILNNSNSIGQLSTGGKGQVHFTDPQSMDYHEWATQMDYLNGRLNGLPKWTTLNYLPCNEKDNQSLLVLIDNTKDSINERFGLQLTSGRSKKLTHLAGMHVIINIQSFTCVNLLSKAKFYLPLKVSSCCPHTGRIMMRLQNS